MKWQEHWCWKGRGGKGIECEKLFREKIHCNSKDLFAIENK